MASTRKDNKEEDIFDAFGLRDDDNDTAKGFDPFSSDVFAAAPAPAPVAPAEAIARNDTVDSDPLFVDPFVVEAAAVAPRGFKKQPKPLLAPPPADTRPVSSAAGAAAAAAEPFVADFDTGIGPSSPAPFPASTSINISTLNTTMDTTSGSFVISDAAATAAASRAASRAALPPRLGITFLMHEEVTSHISERNGGGGVDVPQSECHASIEGKVQAMVQSSDARRNVPFQLVLRDTDDDAKTQISINRAFVDDSYKVSIPKTSIGNIPIASYTSNAMIQNMPVVSLQINTFICLLNF